MFTDEINNYIKIINIMAKPARLKESLITGFIVMDYQINILTKPGCRSQVNQKSYKYDTDMLHISPLLII